MDVFERYDNAMAENIASWWNRYKDDRNAWCRTPIGKIIQKIVKESGHWKNIKRGNPSKGYRAMKQKEGQ